MSAAHGPRWPVIADYALALALFVLSVGELAVQDERAGLGLILVAAVVTLPLSLRRRFPALVMGTLSAGLIGQWLFAAPPQLLGESVALLVATYSVVVHSSAHRRLLLGLAAATAAAVVIAAKTPGYPVGGQIISASWILVPMAVGVVVRRQLTRTTDAIRHSELEVARLIADERARIARDLHDVVAHALAVVVLHARGGRSALAHAEYAATAGAFDVIESSGGDALEDMRRLLTLLRDPAPRAGDASADTVPGLTPPPDLRLLDDLVRAVRAGGVPVDLQVTGRLDVLPDGISAAAYRFLQEALTNVLKHAPDATARVRIGAQGQMLELEVSDDAAAHGPPGTGHGLIGMRERVDLYGGRFESGPAVPAGFRVFAAIPLARA